MNQSFLSYALMFFSTEPYLDFYHVVYYDQRASGKIQIINKTKIEHHNLRLMLEHIRETVYYLKRKYKTGRIILCGHSFESMLGVNFLDKYPDDRAEFTKAVHILSDFQMKYGYYHNDYMSIFKKSPILGFKDWLQFARSAKYDSKLIVEVEYQFVITHLTTYRVPPYFIFSAKKMIGPQALSQKNISI